MRRENISFSYFCRYDGDKNDCQQMYDTGVFDDVRGFFNVLVVLGHLTYSTDGRSVKFPYLVFFYLSTLCHLFNLCRFSVLLSLHSVDVFLFLRGYLFGLSFCRKK